MKKLHMIGNAHLDPVWLWNWREGYQENKATFQSVLDRMDESDDFIFTSSSAQFYQWIENDEPDMFQKIKQRVQEGRWIICGGWWVQPDCNIPSGESFARHALLAQNYFYRKFGVIAHTGYCVDSFGHNAMLPQILKKSGMENYVFMRPGPHEKELPARAFLWEAPDGSRVKAFRIPFSYGLNENLEENVDRIMHEYSDGVDHMMCFYGVGDHGGGPTRENIKKIHTLQKTRNDVEIIFSNPDQYFKSIEGCSLPVVKDDLQHHSPGCYSAESMIKTMNRRSENMLLSAEKFSVLAEKIGKHPFRVNLNEAWELLLFNQFHDILAGSSTKEAYFDARNQLGEVMSVADRCRNSAIQSISFDIDIPYEKSAMPLVIFNPHSWDVKAPVEFETGMFANKLLPESIRITDSDGKEIPHQFIHCSAKVPGLKRFTFLADVPALGYAVFMLREGKTQRTDRPPEGYVLENEDIKIEFDLSRGTISKVFDKKTKQILISQPSRARVICDNTDTWGHTLEKLDDEIGEFRAVSAKVIDFGKVRTSIQMTSKYNQSTLVQTFSLYQGDDKIYVKASVNWQEHRCALKFDFPVNTKDGQGVVEIPYGHFDKASDGREEPMQKWADLYDENFGIAILNDGKYGVDFRNNCIGLTILRSPVFAHHDPYALRSDEEYDYMDQGISEFNYIIKPHQGSWKRSSVVRDAALFNQPLVSMFETFHHGDLPQRNSFLSIDKDNINMTALKKSYDGKRNMIRMYETIGEKTLAEIHLFGISFQAEFRPYEIKTYAVDVNGDVYETNFIEHDLLD